MLPRLQGRIQLLVAFRSGGIFKDVFHGWKEHRQELTCGVAGRCRRPTENKILRLELDQKPKPLISLQKKNQR